MHCPKMLVQLLEQIQTSPDPAQSPNHLLWPHWATWGPLKSGWLCQKHQCLYTPRTCPFVHCSWSMNTVDLSAGREASGFSMVGSEISSPYLGFSAALLGNSAGKFVISSSTPTKPNSCIHSTPVVSQRWALHHPQLQVSKRVPLRHLGTCSW